MLPGPSWRADSVPCTSYSGDSMCPWKAILTLWVLTGCLLSRTRSSAGQRLLTFCCSRRRTQPRAVRVLREEGSGASTPTKTSSQGKAPPASLGGRPSPLFHFPWPRCRPPLPGPGSLSRWLRRPRELNRQEVSPLTLHDSRLGHTCARGPRLHPW